MLSVKNLTGGYSRTMILRNVDIDVGEGEIVAIIGRNGVGKSTLMKSIVGLIRPVAGSVSFWGDDITHLAAFKRAHLGIAYVPQGRGIFRDLTVDENLAMGRLINSQEKEKTFELAHQYFPRLAERQRQKAGTLSGGEQSMLAIGRVLVGKPSLLVLDEPSEGIQPNIVRQIGNDLCRINQELKTTILLVEQNFELIRQMAQRGYVLDKGTVVATLDTNDLQDTETLTRYLAV
jgi:branched-chain amino acid transport system ATP-binding protein